MRRPFGEEPPRRASAPPAKLVVRHERGEPLVALGLGLLGALALFGALYALGANEVKYFCSGFVAIVAIVFAGATFVHGRDRRPKLVIGPKGVKNLQTSPPTLYSFAGARDVSVSLLRSRRYFWLTLSIQYSDGREEKVTFDLAGLDHAPDVIADHVREAWRCVRTGEQAERPGEEEDY